MERIYNRKVNHSCVVWYIVRDFNSVKKGDERKGTGSGVVNSKEIAGFNNFI